MKVIFSINFRSKTKKIVTAVYEKNISVWFLANLDTFSRISPNQDFFFQKSSSVTFLPLQSPNFMQKKLEKSLEPFLRKLCYQLTNYYQQHRSYRTSLTPVQKLFPCIFRHAIHYTPFCNGTYKELENLLHLFFLFTYKYSYWIFIYGIQYADAPCTQQVNAYSKVSTHHD